LLVLALGCSGAAEVPADGERIGMTNAATGQVVPDFVLPNLNPGAPAPQSNVSPRAFLNQVSVWYFASAT